MLNVRKRLGRAAMMGVVAFMLTGAATAHAVEGGRVLDPASTVRGHSHAEAPALPPHVPPHGAMPHETEEEDGATSASTTTYITYRTGWTQTAPKIYVVYWGDWSTAGDPYNVQNYLWNFYRGLSGSGWNQTQTQYGYNCGSGAIGCSSGTRITNSVTFGGYVYDKSFVPAKPTVAQMEAEAQWAASHFGDRSVNAQYVIAMPTGHRDVKSINAGFCAWHNYTWSSGKPVSYTSMPYIPDMGTTCGMNKVNAGTAGRLDGVSILAGHEFVEAEVDPFLNAWLDSDNYENSDKCLQWGRSGYFRNYTFSTGTFAVQPNWSNYAYYTTGNGCVFWS